MAGGLVLPATKVDGFARADHPGAGLPWATARRSCRSIRRPAPPMLSEPASKYRPLAPMALPDRRWPSQTLRQAPAWLSTDLRDGNQALFEPMNGERKLRLFDELVRIGFKEIEVGFPAASATDFGIVRRLIEQDRIPADVTPMVMTQLREDLIERTVASLAGARRAIVHLYNAIAPV